MRPSSTYRSLFFSPANKVIAWDSLCLRALDEELNGNQDQELYAIGRLADRRICEALDISGITSNIDDSFVRPHPEAPSSLLLHVGHNGPTSNAAIRERASLLYVTHAIAVERADNGLWVSRWIPVQPTDENGPVI